MNGGARQRMGQQTSGPRSSRRAALRGLLAAGAVAFALGGQAAATGPAAAAPAGAQAGRPPRILLPADFAEIRAKVAAQTWARDSFNALKRNADGLVRSLPPIPDQGGGWYHAGGEGYEITRVHNRLAEGARMLGLLYRLTDDPAAAQVYGQAARTVLLGCAARYQGYEAHDQYGRTGPKAWHPGKALSQGLDEGIWLAALAFGFDLVQEALSEEDRQQIGSGLLRPAADLLTGYNVGRHNHQTCYNLGIGLAGLALDEPRYIEYAILKPDSGLLYQLSPGASFTSDGFWYEGSVHYHFYALEGILGLAEAAQRNGYEPYAAPALRGAFDFPLAYADAAGRLPAFNDGPPATLSEAWRARMYEIGYRRFGDPRYAALLASVGRGSSIHGLVVRRARAACRRAARGWPGGEHPAGGSDAGCAAGRLRREPAATGRQRHVLCGGAHPAGPAGDRADIGVPPPGSSPRLDQVRRSVARRLVPPDRLTQHRHRGRQEPGARPANGDRGVPRRLAVPAGQAPDGLGASWCGAGPDHDPAGCRPGGSVPGACPRRGHA